MMMFSFPIPLALTLIIATVVLLPLSLSFIVRHRVLPVKRQFLAGTLDSREWCEAERGRQQDGQKCNVHNTNRLFHCPCGLEDVSACQAVLPPVDQPDEQLLTIGVAFPLLEQFMEDPEGVFLEDLELFMFIPRESIVIYRRGCSPDGMAYEFDIGLLQSSSTSAQPQLRTVSPRIFLANPFFMDENALKIAYVRAATGNEEES